MLLLSDSVYIIGHKMYYRHFYSETFLLLSSYLFALWNPHLAYLIQIYRFEHISDAFQHKRSTQAMMSKPRNSVFFDLYSVWFFIVFVWSKHINATKDDTNRSKIYWFTFWVALKYTILLFTLVLVSCAALIRFFFTSIDILDFQFLCCDRQHFRFYSNLLVIPCMVVCGHFNRSHIWCLSFEIYRSIIDWIAFRFFRKRTNRNIRFSHLWWKFIEYCLCSRNACHTSINIQWVRNKIYQYTLIKWLNIRRLWNAGSCVWTLCVKNLIEYSWYELSFYIDTVKFDNVVNFWLSKILSF